MSQEKTTPRKKQGKLYDIKKSTEEGFTLEAAFDFNKTEGYERDKNLDYYYESYS